jgi:Kef-type K+ transport system membrane component KefB
MSKLAHPEMITLILSIGIMLLVARFLGELARKLKMPLVVGEIIGGIFLGPSILGRYYPDLNHSLFPLIGNVPIALNGITSISVIMLLFVAGMEVELSLIRKQGTTALKTSFLGLSIPMVLGFYVAHNYYNLFRQTNTQQNLVFSLFIGTAMSISALPVIARTLMDLKLFKTKIGMIIIAAAMVDDVIGWLMFSVVLALMKTGVGSYEVLYTLGYTLLYALLMLTIGKKIIDKSLPWAQRNFSWPGGILSIALGLSFIGAAFTEYIGIHAIFGAFIMGIAFGDSVHMNERTREIINQFVTNVFAPLFFVAIGLKINFIANFDLNLVILILGLAIVTKMLGAGLGALWGNLSLRESLAVGFGMNARGAMEIILALLALEAKLITEPLFVAIVIMAVVTSVMSGPFMQWMLQTESLKYPAEPEEQLGI